MTLPADPLLNSLRCAWVQTPDLDLATVWCTDAIGLAVLDAGEAGSHWATDAAPARWVLLGDPDESAGRLCLIEGVARPEVEGLQRGLDSVEIVVTDVDRAGARIDAVPGARRVGRTFVADLAELGGNQHRSALWCMPWGTHVIITAGVTPTPGRAFPSTDKEAGRIFEVHVRTERYEEGLRLYRDSLEMPTLMSARLESGAIHDAWGIPSGAPVAMDLLKTGPEGTGLGAVELQGHEPARLQQGSRGGTAGLTFDTADLARVRSSLEGAGYRPGPVGPVAEGPWVGTPGFTLSGVEGELLEFIAADGGR